MDTPPVTEVPANDGHPGTAWKAQLRHPLGAVCVVLFVAAILLAQYFHEEHRRVERGVAERALPHLQGELELAAQRIEMHLQGLEPQLLELARGLSGGMPMTQTQAAMEAAFDTLPVCAVGIAWTAPGGVEEGRLSAPYVTQQDGELRWFDLAQQYDYTVFEPRNQWFYDVLLDGAGWFEPYYHPAIDDAVVGFAAPFFESTPPDPASDPAGVVYAFITLRELPELTGDLDLGTYGYTMLFTEQGSFLQAPQLDFVAGLSFPTIFEQAWERGQKDLATMAVRAIRGQAGQLDLEDRQGDPASWILYQSIPASQWVVSIRAFKSNFQPSRDELRRRSILVAVTALVAFVFLGGALCTFYPRQWLVSIWFGWLGSVALLLTIAAVWYLSDRYPQENTLSAKATSSRGSSVASDPNSFTVVNQDVLQHYLDGLSWKHEDRFGAPPLLIPTGVFIQSVEFLSSVNIRVTGYLWQKYGHHLPPEDTLPRRLILPEAESTELKEMYRLDDEDHQLIGWYFNVVLRQSFDYAKYPKDRQDVWLRMWPQDFADNVVLVPDLDAYTETNPALRPGIEEDLVLPGLEVESTFYSYRPHSYSTNFGIKDYVGLYDFPELYFNIKLRRHYLEPVISRVVPVLVCALILFTLVMTFSRKGDVNALGFSVTTIALGCAALFFVIIFDHIALRDRLASANLIYFEYFYFSLYFMMILVLIYSLIFATRPQFQAQNDHFLAKLSFWPIFLTVLLFQTLAVFF